MKYFSFDSIDKLTVETIGKVANSIETHFSAHSGKFTIFIK